MRTGTPPAARWLLVGLAVCAALCARAPARAEHFDVLLTLRSSRGAAEGFWDTEPPKGGRKPRQTVSAPAGEELLLEWRLRSEFPHGVMRKVLVRLYAAPDAAPAEAPPLFENSFTADFLPHHAARGQVRFRATRPGLYLVRLESELTREEHNHEHFAALNLKVE